MAPRIAPRGITSDFRNYLDERFSRVDDRLGHISTELGRQNAERDRQFKDVESKTAAALEASKDAIEETSRKTEERFLDLEKKVDASDRALRIVGGISAAGGSVLGVAFHWLWAKLSGQHS